MGRKWAAAMMATLMVLLTGCGFRSPEELYALPRLSSGFESLQTMLEELEDQGYEYSAPTAGANTQSVQMKDLNGDGTDEALAFFRDNSGGEKPLKICIFGSNGDEEYELLGTIEGEGDAINSVTYCQLNDTPNQEIVVGWRISGSVNSMSVYSLENGNVTEVTTIPNYTRYQIQDLDQDNQSELVIIQMATPEEGGNLATYFDWRENTLMSVNTTGLSVGVTSFQSIQYGYLVNNIPALFLTGSVQDVSNEVITDILAVENDLLTNVTLDEELGVSTTRRISLLDPQDINSDTAMDLPYPISLPSSSVVENSESFYVISWWQYYVTGRAAGVGYSYHDVADGWYLLLPQSWMHDQNRLVLSRNDINLGATNERGITFYYRQGETGEPEAFLIITKNTGSNRTARGSMGKRFVLLETENAVYSAEILDDPWGELLDEQTVRSAFHLITTDWSRD